MTSKSLITAIGTYVPAKRLTNDDLEKMVDTRDEWIVQRTGMRERRISGEAEFTSDLCIKAVENLMKTYDKKVDDVDMIIVATSTADYSFPSTACKVQEAFQIKSTGAFDLSAACSGFVYALTMANGLISSGLNKKILVIGAETMSRVIDYTDRTTCILFGDGAGAVLVEYSKETPGFNASIMGTDGSGGQYLYLPGLTGGNRFLVQNGREVYKWATRTVSEGIERLLAQAGMGTDDIDWFVPHSANLRIIESICARSGVSMEKTLYSVEYMGNTSSASIPLALHIGIKEKKVKQGDTVLLYGFGGGLTHAGVIVNWVVPDLQ
ncbi:ketoacyl-ACP synthase III [Bacillus sp. SJS]|uniref:ketoacyl-ACP synthase III n=1 Tax=Bacillus sp. SJS TaxID=1423321 RepID=UPI0004DD3E0A|nr:ketoacyl-ACP synthase III [Bacillus sp. SJS]KZZ84120.1 3-oxoacyl-ACP synthase [Bacillus sp. SJS]